MNANEMIIFHTYFTETIFTYQKRPVSSILISEVMNSIPVIDLAGIIDSQGPSENFELWTKVASEIRKALSGIGFLYIKNHGISQETIDAAFNTSSIFFNLPDSIKSKYRKNPEVSSHGWVQAGQELLHPNSVYEIRECFDIAGRNRIYPTLEEHNNFGSAMECLEDAGNKLMIKLLKLLGLSLELEDTDYFVKCCRHLDNPFNISSECDLRAIFYPAVPDTLPIPPGTVRCAEHTDYEILTLLFQDNVGGLEVKNVHGTWIPATPIDGTILVNTGDLLQFWTNGFYPATFHRVVIPEQEIMKRIPRYSIAYFFAPDDDTVIFPLKSKYCSSKSCSEINDKQTSNSLPVVTAYEHIMNRVKEAYKY